MREGMSLCLVEIKESRSKPTGDPWKALTHYELAVKMRWMHVTSFFVRGLMDLLCCPLGKKVQWVHTLSSIHERKPENTSIIFARFFVFWSRRSLVPMCKGRGTPCMGHKSITGPPRKLFVLKYVTLKHKVVFVLHLWQKRQKITQKNLIQRLNCQLLQKRGEKKKGGICGLKYWPLFCWSRTFNPSSSFHFPWTYLGANKKQQQKSQYRIFSLLFI